MEMLIFIGFVVMGFCGMEMVSYLVHRFIFHGILWDIHQTHHKPNHGLFELNDLFSLFFAGISIYLMLKGAATPFQSPAFSIGLGIALYGILYFVIHDIFAHKRFLAFKSNNRILRLIRYAHQRHHQSIEKEGQEPFGLFLFPYDKYEKDKSGEA